MIIFRVGADDAKYLAQEADPPFSEEDLIGLPQLFQVSQTDD